MKTEYSENNLASIFQMIEEELESACNKFNAYHSGHEGYAVIKEELDELWDEIKGKHHTKDMQDEAIQVATTAIRFIIDICYNSNNPESLL